MRDSPSMESRYSAQPPTRTGHAAADGWRDEPFRIGAHPQLPAGCAANDDLGIEASDLTASPD